MTTIALIESILAIILVVIILLQNKSAGLGSAIGGDANGFSSTKEANSLLTNTTVVVALLFFGTLITDVFFL
ncbi:MAG: preprotein translocase subunit SecG [Patescibacteria group bacterium]|nr:preprotein translocase subunit SecG [Patescibacteria group bacterium]